MMVKLTDLKSQYHGIKKEIDAAMRAVIRCSSFIGGSYVRQFEEEFAKYQQARYCVGVANGTDSIEIALEALGLPKSSEVLVPANTFIASAEAITRAGHRVVFCDCDPETYTVSVPDAEKRITRRTRAVIAVHLYGRPCDMGALLAFAGKNNLKIIEDCAQAHGAVYKGRKVGAIGDIGSFSFYPGKNLGAYGDAGAIVTNNAELGKKCRMIANHGRIEKYNHEFEGRNSRLDGLQAAILSVKLKHLDKWTKKRREIAAYYLKHISQSRELILPKNCELTGHVWHQFVVRTEKRELLQKYLKQKGIESGIHYPISLPKLKAYEYCGQAKAKMAANQIDGEVLSLPIGEHMSTQDIRRVVSAVNAFFK